MKLDLIETLAGLVQIPSVNPMGDSRAQGADGVHYEARLTDHLEGVLEGLGLPTWRQAVETLPAGTRRENLLARLDGTTPPEAGGELILWEVHQDTVAVDGMTIDPFAAEVRDGKLFGRGACDVKGAMAAMLVALSRLVERRPAELPTIVLAFTVNEENGFTGVRELVRCWGDIDCPLLPRRPDACVVAEPTELDVVVAHKGVVRWHCYTTGEATHSSQPEQGENAIYAMGHVLAALETYSREVVPALAYHSLCGHATLSVGRIEGGVSVNTVPDSCRIAIDRRLVPGESADGAFRHVVEYLLNCEGVVGAYGFESPYLSAPGLTSDMNGELADRLGAIVRELDGSGRAIGVAFGTDAGVIAESGVPAVVFGPGSIDQAHTADEWIDLAELGTACDVLVALAGGEETS